MEIELSSSLRQQVEKGVSLLKQGGIVAFPTDTVYSLSAAVNNIAAVERIYRIKERPRHMALPLLLADQSQLDKVAVSIPTSARLLAERFMPGALTLVLPRAESVPDIVSGPNNSVAVRIPDHPIALALVRGVGAPLTGTSANLSGRPSALTAEEVNTQLYGRIELIIDGGRCPGGIESTIIDLTGADPVILREGAISRQELEKLCPNLSVKGGE